MRNRRRPSPWHSPPPVERPVVQPAPSPSLNPERTKQSAGIPEKELVIVTEQKIVDGPRFKKSSYSGAVGNQCVEVGIEAVTTMSGCVRDSKDAAQTTLRFTPDEWA